MGAERRVMPMSAGVTSSESTSTRAWAAGKAKEWVREGKGEGGGERKWEVRRE